nr:hypothetical protein [uncultured Butyrivibrio sp.]
MNNYVEKIKNEKTIGEGSSCASQISSIALEKKLESFGALSAVGLIRRSSLLFK